ncbi:MAG: OpgC domain-containing protein [Thermaceae bacterium]|nr:OpgC domain-containing protein [Thermaceae bacterium]
MTLPWLQNLAYPPKGGRDLRIDFLRGYCLFVMTVDHIGASSFLLYITGNIQFYTSAAEGFYFISGLTLGLLAARETFAQTVERLLLRSVVLYRTAILIALGFGAWSLLTGLRVWDDPWPKKAWLEPVWPILTLRQGYAGSEILTLYVLFMVLSPLVMLALFRKKGWLVLVVSGALYAISQVRHDAINLDPTNFASLFLPASWQLLFYGGLVLGFHRADLSRLLARVALLRNISSLVIVLLAIALIWNYTHGSSLWPGLPALALGEDNKTNLSPLRLLLTALYIQAFYVLVTWLWRPLNWALGWLLVPLGSASLWTFTGHIVAIGVLYNIPAFVNSENLWAGTLWELVALLGIWASILLYRRLRRRASSPATATAKLT